MNYAPTEHYAILPGDVRARKAASLAVCDGRAEDPTLSPAERQRAQREATELRRALNCDTYARQTEEARPGTRPVGNSGGFYFATCNGDRVELQPLDRKGQAAGNVNESTYMAPVPYWQ